MLKGPAWDPTRGRREQDRWDEHAAFMDGLVADGPVILGGPVGDGETGVLAMEAADEDDATDPDGRRPLGPARAPAGRPDPALVALAGRT